MGSKRCIRDRLQRGYQVYKEVCAACHSLKFVAFRNHQQLGYTEAEVDAEAASWTVPGIDPATGEANEMAAQRAAVVKAMQQLGL